MVFSRRVDLFHLLLLDLIIVDIDAQALFWCCIKGFLIEIAHEILN